MLDIIIYLSHGCFLLYCCLQIRDAVSYNNYDIMCIKDIFYALAFRMVFQNKGYDLYIRLIIILDTILPSYMALEIVRKSSSNFSKLLNKCFMIKIYMYVD